MEANQTIPTYAPDERGWGKPKFGTADKARMGLIPWVLLSEYQPSEADLMRRITLVESFSPKGLRRIECIDESFVLRSGQTVSDKHSAELVRGWLGAERDRECTTLLSSDGSYPNLSELQRLIRRFPDVEHEGKSKASGICSADRPESRIPPHETLSHPERAENPVAESEGAIALG